MTHKDRALKLAELLVDRVKSATILSPGSLEKWGALVADQIEEALNCPPEGWVKTAFFLETCAELQIQRDDAQKQLLEAQGVIELCVEQGGIDFHDESTKCPQDDTCTCPDVKRVNAAMKGYDERPVQDHGCSACNGNSAHHRVGCDKQ